MANVPAWFDSVAYFNNKLAMTPGADSLSLKTAFENAGYGTSAEGLYEHFVEYGNAEGVSPNALFDANSYLHAKAADYFKTGNVTADQAHSMMLAMSQSGMSAWDHYLQYGAWEQHNASVTNTTVLQGFNPSANFDSQKYLQAKLTMMQVEEPTYTMDMLVQALKDSGYTPLTHYYEFGIAEGLVASIVSSGTPGNTYDLAAGKDRLFGSVGDDYFNADLGTLDTVDYIDGGAGYDTLYATVGENNVATRPTILNVEKLVFQAQGHSTNSGDNNISASGQWQAAIDAGKISHLNTGAKTAVLFGNDNSRADLAIEDVRYNSNNTTVLWSNSDPGDVDFGLFFNAQNLKAQVTEASGNLDLKVMDVLNGQVSNEPLKDQPFGSFAFALIHADGSHDIINLNFRAADAALYTGPTATYTTLLTAFRNAIADLPAKYAGMFTANINGTFEGTATVDGITYHDTGDLIVVSSSQGAVSASNADFGGDVGWGVAPGKYVPSNGRIVWDATTENSITCPLIQTNIQLDNVGRVQWNDASPDCLPSNDDYGSQAGDMVVGSMATRGGVQRFDVTVDRGSWLKTLSSTNNELRMIRVVNGDVDGDGINGNVKAEANNATAQKGQLYIGDSMEAGKGIVAWQDAPKLLSTTGLTDVKFFDGAAFDGDLNIGAQFTAASYQKYLADVDGLRTIYSQYAPDGEFKYNLGKGNDVLNMTVHGGIANDQDFKLLINAGGGDDLVNFSFSSLTANQRSNIISGLGANGTAGHERVSISTGAGNDTVKFWGDGGMIVNTGDGDDAIYVGQLADGSRTLNATGDAYVTEHNAVFLFNLGAPGAVGNELQRSVYFDAVHGAQPLDNNVLSTTNSFVLTKTAAAEVLRVSVEFKGISITGDVANIAATATGNTTATITAEQLNEAIAALIANDVHMHNLIVAKDGAGHSLMIESLVDGLLATTDLNITFNTVLASDKTTGGTVNIGGLTTAYTTNEGFGHLAALASVDSITTQGSVTTQEQHTLTGVVLPTAVTDRYSIKIGDDTYYTQADFAGITDADMVSALNVARDINGHMLSDKYVVDTPVANELTVTYKIAGAQSDVNISLFNLTGTDVMGSNTGTISHNIVDAGAGNDTIVLNVASAAGTAPVFLNDVLTISSLIGNDVVVNFDTAVDRFHVASSMGTFGEGVAAVAVGNDYTKWVAADWTNVVASINGGALFDVASAKGVGYFQNGATNTYTFFQVQNDATATVIQSEVTILGTMTFDNDTTAFATGTGMFV